MSYYDSIAPGYNELHGEEQRRKYRIIKEHLHLPRDANVLDVGAGTGIGHDIIPNLGIDPSAELIKQHPNKESFVGNAERLPFPDKSFDAVISVTALHHADYRKAIDEMLRVSRGPVAVSTLRKSEHTQAIIAYMREKCPALTILEDEKDVILVHEKHKRGGTKG